MGDKEADFFLSLPAKVEKVAVHMIFGHRDPARWTARPVSKSGFFWQRHGDCHLLFLSSGQHRPWSSNSRVRVVSSHEEAPRWPNTPRFPPGRAVPLAVDRPPPRSPSAHYRRHSWRKSENPGKWTRSARGVRADCTADVTPLSKIVPSVGSYSRIMSLTKVLFPEPLCPTRETTSPRAQSQGDPVQDLFRVRTIPETHPVQFECLHLGRSGRPGWVLRDFFMNNPETHGDYLHTARC